MLQTYVHLINSTLAIWTKSFGRATVFNDLCKEMVTLTSGQWRLIDLITIGVLIMVISKSRTFVIKQMLTPFCLSVNTLPANQQKAVENGWKLILHLSLTVIAGVLMTKHGWGKDKLFQDYHSTNPIPSDFYYFFTLQLAYYLLELYNHLFVEEPRKDHNVMTVHHFVTILLVSFVLILKFHRVGTLITFLHDFNDIFFEGGRFLLNLRHKSTNRSIDWCDLAGLCFAISWPITRLVVFPMMAIGASVDFVHQKYNGNFVVGSVIIAWLWMILAMNAYWFMLIVKMIGKSIVNRKPLEDQTTIDSHTHQD